LFKTGRVPYLGLELTMHVIKIKFHETVPLNYTPGFISPTTLTYCILFHHAKGKKLNIEKSSQIDTKGKLTNKVFRLKHTLYWNHGTGPKSDRPRNLLATK
jgi:hypothetical protein